jgi:serine/threonine protein kinase
MAPRRIYRHIGMPTEWVEHYRPGGFHPVHIGDCLGPNDRYIIHKKLGDGGYSTVWLALDSL